VHFSTDYVFSGDATEPYAVDESRKPLNAYGRSKALGEELLEDSGAAYLLIRTSWLYAPWGKNFVRTMVDLGRSRPQVRVVDDQRGRPTSAEHLCSATLQLLASEARGVFHVTDGGEASWYEFARAIFALARCSAKLEPCSSQEFPRPAPRPSYSVLDLSETEKRLGPAPLWQANLESVIARLS
jgi:dTDP-4-dehydrorhamnose reductase